jgi:hypothetical protein
VVVADEHRVILEDPAVDRSAEVVVVLDEPGRS